MFISFLKKNENTRNTLFSILREREVHMNTLEESFIVRSTILCSIMSPAKVLDHSRKASDDDEWCFTNKKKRILINSVVSFFSNYE